MHFKPEFLKLLSEFFAVDKLISVDVKRLPQDFFFIIWKAFSILTQNFFKTWDKLRLLQHSITIPIKLRKHLIWPDFRHNKYLGQLCKDLILPFENRVMSFKSFC